MLGLDDAITGLGRDGGILVALDLGTAGIAISFARASDVYGTHFERLTSVTSVAEGRETGFGLDGASG